MPVALRPYADAARFLLPGFSSVSLSTHELDEAGPNGQKFSRRAFCGSDFERPGGVGVGRFRGIEVADWGPAGLDGGRPEGEPAATIRGVAVWHTHEEHYDGNVTDLWIAWVDDRFIVSSHHRDLLERSLARTGDLATLLQPFAALNVMPAEADGAVCLLPRPEDHTYWGRPVPIETTVVALCGNRLTLFHREPLPPEFLALSRPGAPPTTTSRDPWQVTEILLRADDPTWYWLIVHVLSGLAIFI